MNVYNCLFVAVGCKTVNKCGCVCVAVIVAAGEVVILVIRQKPVFRAVARGADCNALNICGGGDF